MASLAWIALGALAIVRPVNSAPALKADYKVQHELPDVPRHWLKTVEAPADHTITLHFGLKQKDAAGLEADLLEISDPLNPRYGQHLTKQGVADYVRPKQNTLDAVHDFLGEHGLQRNALKHSASEDWITLTLPVSTASRMLDTQFDIYHHPISGKSAVRTLRYSLPASLHEHIDTVQPTTFFSSMQAFRHTHTPMTPADFIPPFVPIFGSRNASVSQVCTNLHAVTNACLRTLYGTIDYVPKTKGKTLITVSGYLNETAVYSDFKLFAAMERPDAINYKYSYTQINGAINHQTLSASDVANEIDIEANLDVQTVGGFVYPIGSDFLSTGGAPPSIPTLETPDNGSEPYQQQLDYLLSLDSIPPVLTTSYGDEEQSVPTAYQERVCNGFAQLGARGVTVIFSSGDFGVGISGDCFKVGTKQPAFLPTFPATCPYVTSVGALQGLNPEVATDTTLGGFASGGGFSNYFSTPAYQKVAVQSYLAGHQAQSKAYAGQFNPNGRGFPDVSAQGSKFAIVWDGKNISVGGTSASAPTVAGIITLLNDNLIANGRPTLGFFNPFLYTIGQAGFTDVTSGSSFGCNTTGFVASKSWDPVTGFGSPNFKQLRTLLGLF
ncbi:uncharacterized protein L969DRAFT_47709 [Mixia osmundae IAM 14324]|uniref:tripeptidyl-peptidase II n=1 Tax=Mixia osmundae (strain CBS 9802 / IAM 14324 / JCM 22182 / KY 12970) TaxID=764103 RepID=G7E9F5_MIXOS|nr:uncharacterized protein L969DRAFT_47709 [Mixia osmundae IAM 14324]KEI39907.1 hypothetical protein L969DRAFT_47709 [Mixia osmundae IAM 14324]GAA99274.1 hypothetical protein E5Q_05969 [Mixia osmundae IAM 14324]